MSEHSTKCCSMVRRVATYHEHLVEVVVVAHRRLGRSVQRTSERLDSCATLSVRRGVTCKDAIRRRERADLCVEEDDKRRASPDGAVIRRRLQPFVLLCNVSYLRAVHLITSLTSPGGALFTKSLQIACLSLIAPACNKAEYGPVGSQKEIKIRDVRLKILPRGGMPRECCCFVWSERKSSSRMSLNLGRRAMASVARQLTKGGGHDHGHPYANKARAARPVL
jgi:hypothetical protein